MRGEKRARIADDELKDMGVQDLRRLLQERGLRTNGGHGDLCFRLRAE
jgi:hypothetical protein